MATSIGSGDLLHPQKWDARHTIAAAQTVNQGLKVMFETRCLQGTRRLQIELIGIIANTH